MSDPRAYTEDEVLDKMMFQIRGICKFWAETKVENERERCEGVAHSILAMFDGCTIDIPAVDLVLCPHEADQEYNQDQGKNWYEPEQRISTALHEQFHRRKPK